MSIELTAEQSQAIAAEGDTLVVIDPQTQQAYRLVPEDPYQAELAILRERIAEIKAGVPGLTVDEAMAAVDAELAKFAPEN